MLVLRVVTLVTCTQSVPTSILPLTFLLPPCLLLLLTIIIRWTVTVSLLLLILLPIRLTVYGTVLPLSLQLI